MQNKKIKVLIVDDSAAMRQLLTKILEADPMIEVVGVASDPYFAREKIISLKPDVLTLDVEMPRMDGITFLDKLMRMHPMPVVMVSSLTQNGCDVTLKALELGAVDFFPKPTIDTLNGVNAGAKEIIGKVKAASHAKIIKHNHPSPSIALSLSGDKSIKNAPDFKLTHQIIAIGASTGGTEALRTVLTVLPADMPGIVITQHMPPGFTASFADRLNSICAINIKEAEDGDVVLPGHAYIAPGNYQTALERRGAEYRLRVFMGERVNLHRPSVDVLFDSFADNAGKNSIGIILTGMGDDGARGLLNMRQAGAYTIAQDEDTCVVFGMPREAIECGGAMNVLPLGRIAGDVRKYLAS